MQVPNDALVVESVRGEDDWNDDDHEPVGPVDICFIIIKGYQSDMWPSIIEGLISEMPRAQREAVMQCLFETDRIPWPQGERKP